jgi:hypothetical protein
VKCGARVAVGVAGGYLLGRTRKMKLALMLAGMAAGRSAGGPGELLNRGTKLLGSSPELARLTDEVRGRLLDAGKGAALAVATRQVESLTDRVGKRVESLGDIGAPRRRADEDGGPTAAGEEAAGETAEDAEEDRGAADEEPVGEAPESKPPGPARRPTRPAAAKGPSRRDGTAAAARSAGTSASGTARRGTGRATRTRRGEGGG